MYKSRGVGLACSPMKPQVGSSRVERRKPNATYRQTHPPRAQLASQPARLRPLARPVLLCAPTCGQWRGVVAVTGGLLSPRGSMRSDCNEPARRAVAMRPPGGRAGHRCAW